GGFPDLALAGVLHGAGELDRCAGGGDARLDRAQVDRHLRADRRRVRRFGRQRPEAGGQDKQQGEAEGGAAATSQEPRDRVMVHGWPASRCQAACAMRRSLGKVSWWCTLSRGNHTASIASWSGSPSTPSSPP